MVSSVDVRMLSRTQAREMLRNDGRRRAWARVLRLISAGLGGALAIWTCSIWFDLIGRQVTAATGTLTPAGDYFSLTVDPVLPTLVAALLALAVIKAAGYASGFIVSTAGLIGAMSVTWSLMSTSAVIGDDRVDVWARAIAALALMVICIAVSVTITEVPPLSEKVRRRQLHERARIARDSAIQLRATVVERRVETRYRRPLAPRTARTVLVMWYVIPPTLPLVATLPYVLSTHGGERFAGAIAALYLAVALFGLVAVFHWGVIAVFESPGSRNPALLGFVALGAFMVVALGAMLIVICTLRWPIPLLAVPPLLAGLIVLVGAILPCVQPIALAGLLTQVALANRLFALQLRAARIEAILLASEAARRRR